MRYFYMYFVKEMKNVNNKEESGWLVIAEKSLASMWGNEKDGRIWNKYLNKIDI